MSGDVWRRDEIESPCVQICVLHPGSGLCLGCARSGDEISRWTRMTSEERSEVLEALPGRAELLKGVRRGGRSRRVRPGETEG